MVDKYIYSNFLLLSPVSCDYNTKQNLLFFEIREDSLIDFVVYNVILMFRGPDMTFQIFLCQKLESVGLSEILLESFSNGDNSDYFLLKKTT